MKKVSVIVLILFTLILSSCEKKEEIYGMFDNEAITVDEISYFTERERASIINEYSEKYGVTDYSDFWEKEFDGKTPSQALEERAFDEAVKAKAELILMKEYGVYEDVTFQALKSKAIEYNKEHENKQGNVGLNSIDMDTFYTYYISVGRMETYNRIQEELAVTDEQIAKYRKENDISDDLSDEYVLNELAKERYDEKLENLIKEKS